MVSARAVRGDLSAADDYFGWKMLGLVGHYACLTGFDSFVGSRYLVMAQYFEGSS